MTPVAHPVATPIVPVQRVYRIIPIYQDSSKTDNDVRQVQEDLEKMKKDVNKMKCASRRRQDSTSGSDSDSHSTDCSTCSHSTDCSTCSDNDGPRASKRKPKAGGSKAGGTTAGKKTTTKKAATKAKPSKGKENRSKKTGATKEKKASSTVAKGKKLSFTNQDDKRLKVGE